MLPKLLVAGSNPVARSSRSLANRPRLVASFHWWDDDVSPSRGESANAHGKRIKAAVELRVRPTRAAGAAEVSRTNMKLEGGKKRVSTLL